MMTLRGTSIPVSMYLSIYPRTMKVFVYIDIERNQQRWLKRKSLIIPLRLEDKKWPRYIVHI